LPAVFASTRRKLAGSEAAQSTVTKRIFMMLFGMIVYSQRSSGRPMLSYM
jgi:hypothetical protein